MICRHAKYSDGHCAEPWCPLYASRCPRHCASGKITLRCTLDEKPGDPNFPDAALVEKIYKEFH